MVNCNMFNCLAACLATFILATAQVSGQYSTVVNNHLIECHQVGLQAHPTDQSAYLVCDHVVPSDPQSGWWVTILKCPHDTFWYDPVKQCLDKDSIGKLASEPTTTTLVPTTTTPEITTVTTTPEPTTATPEPITTTTPEPTTSTPEPTTTTQEPTTITTPEPTTTTPEPTTTTPEPTTTTQGPTTTTTSEPTTTTPEPTTTTPEPTWTTTTPELCTSTPTPPKVTTTDDLASLCTHEGTMAHPHNVHKYLICERVGTKGWWVQEMPCGMGTKWNDQSKTCVEDRTKLFV